MPYFSSVSRNRLDSCHPDIHRVMSIAIDVYDFSILCGERDKEEQDRCFAEGLSQVQYPDSRHNTEPSLAVDVAPYPVRGPNDLDALIERLVENMAPMRQIMAAINRKIERVARFHRLAGLIQGIAIAEKVDLEWGGDFVNFKDLPHFQLKEM